MQQFARPLRRTSAFAISLSICAALAGCSSSGSDSSDGTASPTGTADTSGTADANGSANSGGASTTSAPTATVGAGGSAGDGGGGNAGMASGGAAGADPGCSVAVASHELDAGIHVTECSPIDYSTNPPSSGRHYQVWAAYQTYDFPVPRGYWVHGLEHGAIVITYNCPGGCPDEVARVESFIRGLPVDPRCVPYDLEHQVILTPDPLLDTRWAMSSWGHTLRAGCIDAVAFEQFYTSHVANGPENTCGGGTILTEATLAPNCGE